MDFRLYVCLHKRSKVDTTLQILTKEASVKIMGNHVLVGRLMILYKVSQKTIYRWVEDNDPRLVTKAAIEIISQETGLPERKVVS